MGSQAGCEMCVDGTTGSLWEGSVDGIRDPPWGGRVEYQASIPVHEVSNAGLTIHMKALFVGLKELCG